MQHNCFHFLHSLPYLYIIIFIYLFIFGRAQAGEEQKEGDRGSEAGSVLTDWQQQAQTQESGENDLSQSQMLSHPGAPICTLF